MTNKPRIAAIAAMGRDRTIGKDNKIPWHIPEDMKYLRETTRGKPLIMGRNTYESIHAMRGTDPQLQCALPARLNIVVTSQTDYMPAPPAGVVTAPTPEDGLHIALQYAADNHIDEVFVFGGATIYQALLPHVERLYLTVIDQDYNGDSFFPAIDTDAWRITSQKKLPADNNNPLISFIIFDRN